MKIPTSLVAGLHLPRWAYWLLSSVLVACGDPRTEGVELGVNGQAIAGGTIDEDEVWSGVVMLETKMSIQGILSSQTCRICIPQGVPARVGKRIDAASQAYEV